MPRKKKSNLKPWEKVDDNDGFIQLSKGMAKSKAWRALNVYARLLYVEMKMKYNGSNELDISFTYAEGEELMHKHTFTKAIDQLIDHGFIRLVRQSGYIRQPNIYGFHDMWKFYGTKVFKVQRRMKRREAKQIG